ncbi:hypothetical protein, partial [Psychrobacter sp.]|uniref:hypothetical protein n=1 Tax=Psychrobacter sp. TaxID=56811 RepID=UPI00356633CB
QSLAFRPRGVSKLTCVTLLMSHQQIITHQITSQLQDITAALERQCINENHNAYCCANSGNDR